MMSISHSDLKPISFTVVVRNSDRHRIGTLIAIPRNPQWTFKEQGLVQMSDDFLLLREYLAPEQNLELIQL